MLSTWTARQGAVSTSMFRPLCCSTSMPVAALQSPGLDEGYMSLLSLGLAVLMGTCAALWQGGQQGLGYHVLC